MQMFTKMCNKTPKTCLAGYLMPERGYRGYKGYRIYRIYRIFRICGM